MKYFNWEAIGSVALGGLVVMILLIYSAGEHATKVQALEKRLSVETAALEAQTKKVIKYKKMVALDDRLLMGFMHGTWSRDCTYDIIAGELLADGDVRETLIQHCGD